MIALLAWLWIAGCGGDSGEAEVTAEVTHRVTWSRPRPAEVLPIATLPAEVIAAPGAAYAVGPGVTGRLLAWHVAPGDVVVAGQPLAEVRSPELSALAGRVRTLDAEVAAAERRVALVRAARAHGVSRAVDAADAEAELERLSAERDALTRALRAHRDTSTGAGLDWTWRAPGDGVVMDVTCALQPVEPGAVCVTVLGPGEVWLRVAVPERHLAYLEGVSATAEFTSADGRVWSFTERGRAPHVRAATRARDVYFVPSGAGPLVGASGHARVWVPAPPGALEVPSAALTTLDGAAHVFVRTNTGAVPVAVEVLGTGPDTVVVEGLDPAVPVATTGVFLLKSLALLGDGET